MNNLKEYFRRKKNIKDSSIKTYVLNIQRLHRLSGSKKYDLKFLNHPKKVISSMKSIPITSKKNLLTAVIVLSTILKKDEKVYGKELSKLNADYVNQMVKQKRTPKQEKNWATIKEINDTISKLKDKVRRYSILKKDVNSITKKEKQILQDYLIILLYSNYHVRNDFSGMKRISSKKYRTLKKTEKESNNWLVLGKKKQFHFWKFKNSKYVDLPIKYKIDKLNVVRLLNKWLKINDSPYLLVNGSGPMSANSLTKTLQRIFKKYLKKSISTSLLRHIYISDTLKNDKSYMERKNMARKYMHKMSTADIFYRKVF